MIRTASRRAQAPAPAPVFAKPAVPNPAPPGAGPASTSILVNAWVGASTPAEPTASDGF